MVYNLNRLLSFRDLDEQIDKLKNRKTVELFNEVYDNDDISNYVYEFDLTSSKELQSSVLLFDEITKKVRNCIRKINRVKLVIRINININISTRFQN